MSHAINQISVSNDRTVPYPRSSYSIDMIADGEKGAISQRGRETFAIIPHLPCGLVTPEFLRKIADVAEKFNAKLKCTGAQRIAIIGLREEDIDPAWEALGGCRPGHAVGNVVRSIKVCPGKQYCKRARQDSLEFGMELDKRFYGRKLPGKLKIGVSGCPNQCSETAIKDIGLVGEWGGWRIHVGGQCGMTPRLAQELTFKDFSTDEALETVEKILDFYEKTAQPGERLGTTLARVGIDTLRKAVGVA